MHVQENVIGYAHLHIVSNHTNLVSTFFSENTCCKKDWEKKVEKSNNKKITRLYLYLFKYQKKKMTEDVSTFPTHRNVIFLSP